MLYMDVQYLLFCFCWDAEHTSLDFLIEFELIIVYELTLCGILVLFSLHLLLYAWVLNLVILYHIFFANLNHLCMYLIFQSATYSFFLYFSNLYGYEIDFVCFKDLKQSFIFSYFPKTLFIYVSTTFQ